MAWDRQGVLERCAMSAATAWGFYLMARFVNHRWREQAMEQKLQELQAALEHERVKRNADRVGRIRAEQELRAARVELQKAAMGAALGAAAGGAEPAAEGPGAADAAAGSGAAEAGQGAEGVEPELAEAGEGGGDAGGAQPGAVQEAKRRAATAAAALAVQGSGMPAYPFRPIGHLQSVFTERNGTPRQPQLVTAARSRLVLSPSIPRACLEGLEQYSHVWVLYVFHANTDLAKYMSADRTGLKAKVHVPRLNGGRMGVLATRSPHRPSPIGLSTARVLGLEGNTLLLGGTDIVDGSPVLDIKPYVPFCDCLTHATAPAWVAAEADDEPLAIAEVSIPPGARTALERAWAQRRNSSMYSSAEEYLGLVKQVLSRDIRSLHQRMNLNPIVPAPGAKDAGAGAAPAPPPGTAAAAGGGEGTAGAAGTAGAYHVVLENVYITYDIAPGGAVTVVDAWVDKVTARWWNQ
ncbi:hypothetical protein HYH03_010531 [Edaphochlamys debaryana]|uniref:TsaA-like domain-containing protein n=1 Tax=Edaphochlamys debaryana TaxID=47281 RepID=A0A835XTW1_9CHLO|nr:hypothetical protein HYH03_010531 [Edaphochlamys debaryana]|eukprot:KAG2491087.1 hypothetical protein HYH03_010531 [Edaphochlamys debaryana]